MICILDSRYSDFQKQLLAKALDEGLYYVCNKSPASFGGCKACPSSYKRICKDLRAAADHMLKNLNP